MEQPAGVAPAEVATAWQVADLLVDVERAQVTRDGAEVPLPKLSFDMLRALVEASPRILSLDELMDRVWSGVVVSPETVSQRAKLLRDALGDDTRAPRYFAAVRGRGYRLVAPVTLRAPGGDQVAPGSEHRSADGDNQVSGAEQTNAAGPPAPPAVKAPPSSRTFWTGIGATGLAIAALAALWLVFVRPADRASAESRPPPAGTTAPDRSVAVLPFDSVGGSRDGEVLAFGIAEAVLHQLANLKGLVVIARTSSFAHSAQPVDVRAIGRTLNVRYLLEGSVQEEAGRLRITAQLIDTATGAHVWSLRFDKPHRDVFTVQDEIATQVAQALQLSVQAQGADKLAPQGTSNFDAYLTYLQGRRLLATGKLGDADDAIDHFQRSLRLDPAFAATHVSLAEAEVFAAEFDATDDRERRFAMALRRAQDSVDKALALDPGFGPAYLMRGYCEAFSDLRRAESSYRRGLQLRPNDARGYAGLAAVLFEDPSKRGEALQMVERARRLDPLEPAHDVTKAVFLMYDRGDVVGAESLLRNVLQRQPQYVPALVRLGELDMCCRADPSEAVELLERAIALDPGMHWPRRVLLRSYLNAGDVAAAESVAMDSPGPQEVLQLVLLVRKADWLNAGEVAYDALMQRQVAPIDEPVAVFAIRRHARLTGDYMRAGAALTGMSNTTWGADGAPSVPAKPGVRAASLGLADLLQQTGDPARTRALLDEVLGQMGAELRSPGRFPTWYYSSMGLARALRGESAQALAWLQRGADAGTMLHDWDLLTGSEPAFDPLRGTAEFDALRARVKAHAARERAELDALRAQGRIPRRDGASAK